MIALRNRAHSISRFMTQTAWQTLFLFGVDGLTNVTNYLFHLYLGRSLAAGDFAIVQTINSTLLIAVTAVGVLQPVMAKYAAESESETQAGLGRAIFQSYFWQSALLGLLLTLLVLAGRAPIAGWLNVPSTVVGVAAWALLFSFVQPVVVGMLQGRQQFIAFGLTRTAYAVGRLVIAVGLISFAGYGAIGGVLSLPLGAALALGAGLLWLGKGVWRRGAPTPHDRVREGWKLSLAALVAYAAYMALINLDLIWVNRSFTAELAGSYASGVVLRRMLVLLPGAVLVILYPKVVERVLQGQLPDSILVKALAVILSTAVVLTAAFFAFGATIVEITVGEAYPSAASLLGWMSIGMTGYSIAAVWMNLFLATRPWPFVLLLGFSALLQGALFAGASSTLLQVTLLFGAIGWLLATGGLLLYLFWLRPQLIQAEPTAGEGR